MTFKALLYMRYTRRGAIGAKSKEQGGCTPWNFLAPSEQSGGPWHLDLINIQTKLLLSKMQHLLSNLLCFGFFRAFTPIFALDQLWICLLCWNETVLFLRGQSKITLATALHDQHRRGQTWHQHRRGRTRQISLTKFQIYILLTTWECSSLTIGNSGQCVILYIIYNNNITKRTVTGVKLNNNW